MDRRIRPNPGLGGLVEHVVLVFDPALEVDAKAVAAEWAIDPEAQQYLAGEPEVRQERTASYDFSLLDGVLLPLATNVASTILTDLAVRLYHKVKGPKDKAQVKAAVERAPSGELVVVIVEVHSDQTGS
jgi:hypothetical protein